MNISGGNRSAGFYKYVPGSILEDYMTLELEQGQPRRTTLISAGDCKLIAARIDEPVIQIVVFGGWFTVHAEARHGETVATEPFPELSIRTRDRSATSTELADLEKQGYSSVVCKWGSQ